MGAAISLIAIAAGAIMRYAVTVQNSHGFDVHRVGVIIMIVGIVGLVISVLFWRSWGGVGTTYRRRTISQTTAPAAPGARYDAAGNPIPEPGTSYVNEERRY
jgi:hypothetical protein